jgi:hypothetical protein
VHPTDVRVIEHPEGGRIPGLGGANGVSHGNGMPADAAGFELGAWRILELGEREGLLFRDSSSLQAVGGQLPSGKGPRQGGYHESP